MSSFEYDNVLFGLFFRVERGDDQLDARVEVMNLRDAHGLAPAFDGNHRLSFVEINRDGAGSVTTQRATVTRESTEPDFRGEYDVVFHTGNAKLQLRLSEGAKGSVAFFGAYAHPSGIQFYVVGVE